jgi:hypothetical protein
MLLAWTLVAEIVYFVCDSGIAVFLHRSGEQTRALWKTISILNGTGNVSLGLQMVTAFPLIAGVSIFLAYRYLGIPPRRIT